MPFAEPSPLAFALPLAVPAGAVGAAGRLAVGGAWAGAVGAAGRLAVGGAWAGAVGAAGRLAVGGAWAGAVGAAGRLAVGGAWAGAVGAASRIGGRPRRWCRSRRCRWRRRQAGFACAAFGSSAVVRVGARGRVVSAAEAASASAGSLATEQSAAVVGRGIRLSGVDDPSEPGRRRPRSWWASRAIAGRRAMPEAAEPDEDRAGDDDADHASDGREQPAACRPGGHQPRRGAAVPATVPAVPAAPAAAAPVPAPPRSRLPSRSPRVPFRRPPGPCRRAPRPCRRRHRSASPRVPRGMTHRPGRSRGTRRFRSRRR